MAININEFYWTTIDRKCNHNIQKALRHRMRWASVHYCHHSYRSDVYESAMTCVSRNKEEHTVREAFGRKDYLSVTAIQLAAGCSAWMPWKAMVCLTVPSTLCHRPLARLRLGVHAMHGLLRLDLTLVFTRFTINVHFYKTLKLFAKHRQKAYNTDSPSELLRSMRRNSHPLNEYGFNW